MNTRYYFTIALSCSLCIGSLSAQDIISTFSAGTEDWVVVDLPDLGPYSLVSDGPWSPVFLDSGGNPGGHISFEDPSQCCSYFFDAPAAFLGDRTTSYGLRLSFDLHSAFDGGSYALPDVVLVGNDGLVLVTLAGPDPTTLWRTYTVTLHEASGWRKDERCGPTPTHDEFMSVLSSLAALRIRGDHAGGTDTSYLDNVILESDPRPPSIVVQPKSRGVVPGQSVRFNVTAIGSVPLSYQWHKDDQPISGANEATYSIAAVQADDLGTYTVKVTNQKGSVTSQGAQLAIGQVPEASFFETGSMSGARRRHRAILLPSGKVLVEGGAVAVGITSVSELYDPANETWTRTGSLKAPRTVHTATLLPNGKVLVAGGERADYVGLSSTELYDPGTGTWAATGLLKAARGFHTATLLANGKVLVTGGERTDGATLSSAELYDPDTGTWTFTGSMQASRMLHTETLLSNGKVLVAGGSTTNYNLLSSAELYDPATGTWIPTGSMSIVRVDHTATLLPNGRVLVAGPGTSAELYDPTTGNWTATGLLRIGRSGHTATLLANGKVLVAGGASGGNEDRAELYDPATETWTETASLITGRSSHTATLLAGGKVLIAGGTGRCDLFSSAELFEPAHAGPLPSLTLLRNADQTLSLSWTGAGTLQQTESLTTPDWQPAPNQANPQTLTAAGGAKFFRVRSD